MKKNFTKNLVLAILSMCSLGVFAQSPNLVAPADNKTHITNSSLPLVLNIYSPVDATGSVVFTKTQVGTSNTIILATLSEPNYVKTRYNGSVSLIRFSASEATPEAGEWVYEASYTGSSGNLSDEVTISLIDEVFIDMLGDTNGEIIVDLSQPLTFDAEITGPGADDMDYTVVFTYRYPGAYNQTYLGGIDDTPPYSATFSLSSDGYQVAAQILDPAGYFSDYSQYGGGVYFTQIDLDIVDIDDPTKSAKVLTSDVISNRNGVEVFPNPFSSSLQISVENPVDVKIVDIQGKVVYQRLNVQSGTKLQLDQLVQGIYYLQTTNNEGVTNISKILKK